MMHKLLTLLLLLFTLSPVLAEPPSAQITSLQGPAVVVTADSKRPAATLDSLSPKTLVELRGDSQMTVVFFASGRVEQFTGPALVGIGKNRGMVFHGEEDARTVAVETKLVQAIDPNALYLQPGTGDVKATRAGGKTTLTWASTEPAPYTVTVVKPAQFGEPQADVWTQQTQAKSVTYDGPKLDPKRSYFVKIEAANGQMVDVTMFRIHDGQAQAISDAEAAASKLKLKKDDTTVHVLLSTLYSQHGMHDKAIAALQEAMRVKPQEEAFMTHMKSMVSDIDATANKNTEYATGYYRAQDELWGTDAYFDPAAWRWSGWDF